MLKKTGQQQVIAPPTRHPAGPSVDKGVPADVDKVKGADPESQIEARVKLAAAAAGQAQGRAGKPVDIGADALLGGATGQRVTSSASQLSVAGARMAAMTMGGVGAMTRDQIFDTIAGAKTPEDIRNAASRYGDLSASYARVTAEEFFESPAARNLTPRQQTAARKAFAALTSRVQAHFTPDGLKGVEGAELKDAALAQHAGYVAGELSRQFPGLNQGLARAAIVDHFKSGGDIEKLAEHLSNNGGPDLEFFKDNGWMVGNGFDKDKGEWSFWGFGDLDVALNVPGVYGGEATLKFAEALAPGQGKELMADALNKPFHERSEAEAAVVEFCMRSSQAGWVVSKLGRGIVEANNPKKESRAPGNWGHHDMMSFDQLKTDKGWPEVVKDIDQTRSFAVHQGIITSAEAEPNKLEEAMLNVMSHGLFDKDDAGNRTLSKHGETLRTYLKEGAYEALANDDFDGRNRAHAQVFGMQSATQAAHAIHLDGGVFPSFLGLFVDSAEGAGKEFDGGGGAGAAGKHALEAFMRFDDSAIPLIGKTRPVDVFTMVSDDLGFDPIPMDGKQFKANCQELIKRGVIEGYGSERVNGDADQGVAPMSGEDSTLAASDIHAVDVGLRLANNTWGSGQVHRHYNELQSKGESTRLERGAYDLFDNHKLHTYSASVDKLTQDGVAPDRAHELGVSRVAFEVYKDLFQLSDAMEELGVQA